MVKKHAALFLDWYFGLSLCPNFMQKTNFPYSHSPCTEWTTQPTKQRDWFFMTIHPSAEDQSKIKVLFPELVLTYFLTYQISYLELLCPVLNVKFHSRD